MIICIIYCIIPCTYNLRSSHIRNFQGRRQFRAICSIWNRSSLITRALVRFHRKWDARCIRKGFKWKNKVCINIAKCFCQNFPSYSEKESNFKQSVKFWPRAIAHLITPNKSLHFTRNRIPTRLKKGFTNCDQLYWFWAIIFIWNRRRFIRANHRVEQVSTKIRLLLSQKEIKVNFSYEIHRMINIPMILRALGIRIFFLHRGGTFKVLIEIWDWRGEKKEKYR